MGTCIICGASADGEVCDTHQEDVVFEFKGSSPDQLTPGRFYKGTVDGFADFGVFVNVGNNVTGLLHRSELDQRLESLDWEQGDTVYVQVTNVRDNGNIDLSWSIRQADSEFRGALVDDPNRSAGDDQADADEPESDDEPEVKPNGGGTATQETTTESATPELTEPERELSRVEIQTLSDRENETVQIEGEVVSARQTSGPTVFELRDETAAVDCAAFEEAGVRAYPEVETGDFVRLVGTVERHNGELQIETEQIEKLSDDERATVEQRLSDAVDAAAQADDVDLLADHAGVAAIREQVRDAATAIRRAVIQSRPVIVRHTATVDGYVAGASLERAVLPLVQEEHAESDAEYHYFDRRPLDDRFYTMDDATNDATSMLDNRERHDEKLPLFVFVNAASTKESRDGLELLDIYGAERIVIDDGAPDEEIADVADLVVNPFLGDESSAADVTTSALGSNVAAHINPEIRDDLVHLPAVGYWHDTPSEYVDSAAEAGYDEEATTDIREAVALEAHYQSYEDKRELISDILFDEESGDLAAYVSDQFRTKLDTELETVEPNLTYQGLGQVTFAVLDTDSFTHRFDFPSTDLLLSELHRHEVANHDRELVTLGIGEDKVRIRSEEPLNLRAIADRAAEEAPDADITAMGVREGHLEFLVGERDKLVDAVVAAVTAEREN